MNMPKNFIMSFWNYCVKHKIIVLLTVLFIFFVWGSWIYSNNIRIDTEQFIAEPNTNQGWLTIGRQGGVLTREVLNRWFNPYLRTSFGYLLICISGIAVSFMISMLSGEDRKVYWLFTIIAFTYPIFAELFYFDMMILEIGMGFILSVVGAYYSFRFAINRSISDALISTIASIWAFSTYQTFTLIYIALIALGFIILLINDNEDNNTNWWYVLLLLVGHFIASFLINTVITKIFFSASAYLANQIMWLKRPLVESAKTVLLEMFQGFKGNSTFYSIYYGVFSLLTVILIILKLISSNIKKDKKILLFLSVAVFQIIPFLLNVALGDTTVVRAQFTYAFVLAGNVILSLKLMKHGWMKKIAAVLVICMLWTQIGTTMRLEYTDDVRNAQDVAKIREIYKDIASKYSNDKKVCIVGATQAKLNNACIRGEVVGKSFFEWDASYIVGTMCTSSFRLQLMSDALGIPLLFTFDPECINASCEIGKTLQVWPLEGSITETNDCIVVRIS